MRTLRLTEKFSEKIAHQLASSMGFGPEITSEQLATSRGEAFESSCASDFAWHYLKSECFSKFDPGDGGLSLDPVTYDSFLSNEAWVGLVNERLVDPWSRPWLDTGALRKARSIVARILGKFPWEQFPRACAWSSGASTQFKRRCSQIENKWARSAHVTESAIPFVEAFTRWSGRPFSWGLVPVHGNKVTTVPKSWKTNRTIAIEPDWNMFFQKGVGSLIRSRLQRFGLLKPDAQYRARSMAKRGSVDGSLSTLDLSAASDLVSIAVCEMLLPDDWFKVLTDLRSEVGYAAAINGGQPLTYGKMSSMGNGFTFELETLIFYALASAVSGLGNDDVHVYGDDIICPSEDSADLAILLFECGFWLNEDKSFTSGPFRESCGGHYYAGVDVTPFYFRRLPQHAAELCVTANAILKWCANQSWSELDEFRPVMRLIRAKVPRKFWGPYGVDGVLWSDWDDCRPVWSNKFQAFRATRFVPVYRDERTELPSRGSLLQALWKRSADWKNSEYAEPLRGQYKHKNFTVCRSQWNALPTR